jgi:hypothetical protein
VLSFPRMRESHNHRFFQEIPAVQLRWLPASTKQDVSIMLAYVVTPAGMTGFFRKILLILLFYIC